jgi:hypothetical protein
MKESNTSSRKRARAARPTTALAHQWSKLQAARKRLRNTPFARYDSFTLREAFHPEMVLDCPPTNASLYFGRALAEHTLRMCGLERATR